MDVSTYALSHVSGLSGRIGRDAGSGACWRLARSRGLASGDGVCRILLPVLIAPLILLNVPRFVGGDIEATAPQVPEIGTTKAAGEIDAIRALQRKLEAWVTGGCKQ